MTELIPRRTAALLTTIVAALIASLLVPLAASAAKSQTRQSLYPSVTKVAPLAAGIGDRLIISGKGFRKGKFKNTVVFKRDGKRAIFVRATGTSTKRISVKIPTKMLPHLGRRKGTPVMTRFRVRVLARRFGKRYTSAKKSPRIGPVATGAKGSASDCDGDGTPNARDTDDDNDVLADTLEKSLGTDACKADSDGDGMSDGWEHHSALDRNAKAKPSRSATRPYPNALDAKDALVDHDGDGLSNVEEFVAWVVTGARLSAADSDPHTSPLSYSGTNPNSAGRARRPDGVAYMDRDGNGFLSDFERDADGDGIPNMDENRGPVDAARHATEQPAGDLRFYDYGLFGSLYLEKFATAESAQDSPVCGGINQVPFYCVDKNEAKVQVAKVETLDFADADSDGDGIRDGDDDVDHDGLANLGEYITEIVTAPSERRFGHLDGCVPNVDSASCLVGNADVDGDGVPNRVDDDDDGDLLSDAYERSISTNPLMADTDRDGILDGFEVLSALDLNSVALPYPGKRPYPNALDKEDAAIDHDGDGLTLSQEQKAWFHAGGGLPLSYSDGQQWTGGKVPAASFPAGFDLDGNGTISDDEKDVDNDGLSNWAEVAGPLSGPEWWDRYVADRRNLTGGCDPQRYVETPYPAPVYAGLEFTDPDSDGDGIVDGVDDIDHDGFTNRDEQQRSEAPGAHWCDTYVSVGGVIGDPGHNWNGMATFAEFGTPDPNARVQPFNPCKPVYSDACHLRVPLGYYKEIAPTDTDPGYLEDWASPIRP